MNEKSGEPQSINDSSGKVVTVQKEEAKALAPDGGWGWVVVAMSFMSNMIVDGMLYACGQAYQPVWSKFYGTSTGTTAWVVSIMSATYCFAGPFASSLANIYDCRIVAFIGTAMAVIGLICSAFATSISLLYFTFGVMTGLGFGLIYVMSIVIVGYYFDRKVSIATGIAVCGSGIGCFLYPPLLAFLLDSYTWQQSLVILAGVMLHCAICAATYRPLKPRSNTRMELQTLEKSDRADEEDQTLDNDKSSPINNTAEVVDKEKGQTKMKNRAMKEKEQECRSPNAQWKLFKESMAKTCDVSLIRSPTFLLLNVVALLLNAGFYVPYIYLPEHALRLSFSANQSTMLVSLFGIVNIFSRLFGGWLCNLSSVDAIMVTNVSLLIGGIATFFLPLANHYWMLCVYCVLYGNGTAIYALTRSIILLELLGVEKLSHSLGLCLFVSGLGQVIGSPIAGMLYDFADNYNGSFYFVGTVVTIGAVAGLFLRRLNAWEKKHVMALKRSDSNDDNIACHITKKHQRAEHAEEASGI